MGGLGIQCPGCGKESPEEATFCTYCGSKLLDLSIMRRRLEAERKALEQAVAGRRLTDRAIPPWIVILPIMLSVIAGVVTVAMVLDMMADYPLSSGSLPTEEQILSDLKGAVLLLAATNVVFYGMFAMIAYLVVDGANKHLEADARVRNAIDELLGKIRGPQPAERRDNPWNVYPGSIDTEFPGIRRAPWLWALVVLLPLLGSLPAVYSVLVNDFDMYRSVSVLNYLITAVHAVMLFYMLHFMTDGAWRHDVAWTAFAHRTRVSLAREGITAGHLELGPPLVQRPTWLYILASVLTLGLFIVYWWYAALKDPNTHYEKHARFESQLLELLSPGRGSQPLTTA